MPTKQGSARPRGVHGSMTSDMRGDRQINKSAKPARNRNRVTSAKPAPVARQQRRGK
jgi:hypothetical protein